MMVEGQVYNKIGLEGVKRYKTSQEFLGLLHDELMGSNKLFVNGLGPRLLTTLSALGNELYGVDVNQGPIDDAEEYIATWENYKNKEPFKTEFDFLRSKGLAPRFDRHHFYLEDLPEYRSEFDGELACELFLHLEPEEISEILDRGKMHLKPGGKFIFTVYPSGHPESLDKRFAELASEAGMNGDDFIEDGVIDIEQLRMPLMWNNQELYDKNKDKFWLDLERVRVFPPEEMEGLCEDAGFGINTLIHPRGGMFSHAHRSAYVLEA